MPDVPEITFDAIIASGEAALAKLKERQDELRSELQSLDVQTRRWVGLMKHAGYEFPAPAAAQDTRKRAAAGQGAGRMTEEAAAEWAEKLRGVYGPEDDITAKALAERFNSSSTYMNKVVLALREYGHVRLVGRNPGRGGSMVFRLVPLPAPAQEGDD